MLCCWLAVEREVGQLLRAMWSTASCVAAAVRSSAASAAAAAPTRPVLVLAQSLGRAVDVLEASVHSSHGPFRSAPIAQGSRRGLKLPSAHHVRGSSCCRRSKTKRVPAPPISRGGSYRSASGRISPAAALCSLFARRHATLRPRRRKNRYLSRSPKEPVRRRVRRPNRLQESATHPSTPSTAVMRRARAPKNVRVAQVKP